MVEKFLASIIATITALFSAQTPPPQDITQVPPTKSYEVNIGSATCVNAFDQAYANNAEYSTLWSTNVLIQTCSDTANTLELRTDTENVGNTNKNSQEYTLFYTDSSGVTKNVPVNLDTNPYGPGCVISDITPGQSGEWEKVIATCTAGDGGFSLRSLYSINLKNGSAAKIESCNGRPIAILDETGSVATYSTTEDCTHPFGTTETGGLE